MKTVCAGVWERNRTVYHLYYFHKPHVSYQSCHNNNKSVQGPCAADKHTHVSTTPGFLLPLFLWLISLSHTYQESLCLYRKQNITRPPHTAPLVSETCTLCALRQCNSKQKILVQLVLYVLLSGIQEVVLVIQSQRNSYHARRGEQRKAEILQQATEVGKVTTFRRTVA